ncbi:MAG TPA: flavin reductase [Clostridium sp.]|jgi:flavin reductase (DIM6/NTAB) family NADH-FMN oxidoreductase RutF|uniref:Flavin reductase family protein n=1 Tax=Clostridium lapidicellarium TaxID=3240931 RepID=A0ABV4DZ29_9CLOT|nr:flavin reductase family protein [uncultured Clostridium sp.]NLU06834.1 flavin reductase family protein [Clostridiales bacterium]HBC97183.1 flavin reductase [Clostridium sp.]
MKKITLNAACELTSPNPVTLVCTEKPNGNTNLATVAWYTYLSYEPPMIGFSMGKNSYSGEMVRKNKKVILAMPSAEIAKAAFSCGTASGRNTDKAKEFGIKLTDVENSSIKIPVGTYLAIESTLTETVDVGGSYFYVCTVDNIYGDNTKEAIFAWDGYNTLRPAK